MGTKTSSDLQDRQTRKCEECGVLFSVTAKERRHVWACRPCRTAPAADELNPVGGRASVRGVGSAFADRRTYRGGGGFGGRR